MSIIFVFIHIIFVLVFPKVFWQCHRWPRVYIFFPYLLFFGGTVITLINDSFTSGPREWWVGKICLNNLQNQQLRTSWTGTSCDFFVTCYFWFLVSSLGGNFWLRVLCQLCHNSGITWITKIESSAPSFDRAIVTMICGSSNDSLVVTWLMFGARCGELGMTVWFLWGIWRFLYGFPHFLSSLIDEMSCEST